MPNPFCLLAALFLSVNLSANADFPNLGDVPAPITQGARDLHASMSAPRELFAISEKDDKKILEIRSDQLEKPYLFAATIDKGTGEKGLFSGEPSDTFLFYFKKVGKQVQILRKNLGNRAEPGTPEAKTIAESFPDSLLLTLNSSSTAAGVTIEAKDFFLRDIVDLGSRTKQSYGKALSISEKDSHIEQLKAFPKNLEVAVQLQLSGAGDLQSNLPDSRLVAVTMHYSISALPSSPGFEPRRADSRVGYFQTTFRDYSRPDLKGKMNPTVAYIERWNLEKADPNAPVSQVKNPIVWWLDETIPHEYREYIRAGILSWNSAFEAAGLRNAIVVKEVDKDMPAEERASFDPANASYNVVRWFMGDRTTFAVAPSRVDPLTGEIFNSSIRIGDQWPRLTDFWSQLSGANPPNGSNHVHGPGCAHWEMMKAAATSLSVAEANGPLTAEERQRFVGELLMWTAAHESGHTLGLRHNFKGGAQWSIDKAGETGQILTTNMHYPPANLGPKGKTQGAFYKAGGGAYDQWAVEYGYKPLPGATEAERQAQLRAIAARSDKDPRLAYATDEDATGVDPDAQRWLLGKDPVAFARHRLTLADGLISRLDAEARAGSGDAVKQRERFVAAMDEYLSASALVLPVIGGVRSRRGDTTASAPTFEAVTAEEQRAALKFLEEKVFSSQPYKTSPELLRRMVGDRVEERGVAPYPLTDDVMRIQKRALDHIYKASTLERLSDSTLFGRKAVTPNEVMTTVRRSVWKEIDGPKPGSIDLLRRNLQREHVTQLTSVMGSSQMPGDARAQARRDLSEISAKAKKALAAGGLDDVTRNHLEDVRRTIDDALDNKTTGGVNLVLTPNNVSAPGR